MNWARAPCLASSSIQCLTQPVSWRTRVLPFYVRKQRFLQDIPGAAQGHRDSNAGIAFCNADQVQGVTFV